MSAVNSSAGKKAAERLSIATAEFINTINPTNLWVTQDWHPKGHASFESSQKPESITKTAFGPYALGFYKEGAFAKHGNSDGSLRLWKDPMVPNPADQFLWPDHCLQNEDGSDARVNQTFMDTLNSANTSKIVVVRKGDDPNVDNYSALASVGGKFLPYVVKSDRNRNTKNDTSVDKSLKFKSVLDEAVKTLDIVYVTGIARNVCVKSTFLDMLNYVTVPQYKSTTKITKVVFMYNLARPVQPGFDISVEELTSLASGLLTTMGVTEDQDKFFSVVGDGKSYDYSAVTSDIGSKGVIVVDLQDCFLPGGTLATGNARNLDGGRRRRSTRHRSAHHKRSTKRSTKRCRCGKLRAHKGSRSCQ
jgi:nicotinamidase-related amidase